MEQSITQMSVIINTVIDELRSVNIGKKNFVNLYEPTSAYVQYEQFIEFFLFTSYMFTVDLFNSIKQERLDSIQNTFKIILILYIIIVILIFLLLLFIVYTSKHVFNSFLNFIAILPVQYIIEDDGLFKEILMLEKKLL